MIARATELLGAFLFPDPTIRAEPLSADFLGPARTPKFCEAFPIQNPDDAILLAVQVVPLCLESAGFHGVTSFSVKSRYPNARLLTSSGNYQELQSFEYLS